MATDSNNSTRCDLCRLCLSGHVPTVHVWLLWAHVFTCLDAWTAGILWNSMELWNCAGYVTNFKQPTGGNLLCEDFKCPDSRCYSMKIIKGFRD